MPIYNVTVPDVSPLIVYNGWWSDSSHADGEWNKYVDGTFHATNVYGASASLAFNGSGIYVFGAKRLNHDQYSVTLDGKTTTGNGFSATDIFDQLLFSATDLDSSTEHQIVIQNAYDMSEQHWLDVDYIEVTVGDNNATSRMVDTVWDNNHPRIQYSSDWAPSPDNIDFYYGKTIQRTSTQGSSATITFTGNTISVYGTTATDHGLFSVSLDHGPPLIMNGTAPETRYQTLLYYAGGLTSAEHILTLTNVDTSGSWLDLDKVVLTTWLDTQASASGTGATPNATESAQQPPTVHHMTTGPIVGIVIGVIAVAILGVVCILSFLKHRGRQGVDRIRPSKESIVLGPEGTVVPYMAQPDLQTIETPTFGGSAPSRPGLGAVSYSPLSSSSQTHLYPADKKYSASQDGSPEGDLHQDLLAPPNYTQAVAFSHH